MSERGSMQRDDSPPSKLMLSRTLILLLVCGIAAFIVLIYQLYQIQIRDHARYESAAIEQQVRETAIDSGRGTIYDRSGNILAMSATVDTIYLSPAEIKMYGEDPELIAHGLSEILGVDYDRLLGLAADTRSWYKTVARKVEQETSDRVRQFKNEHDLKGVKIETDSKRYYPYGSLASHVIGFVGFENRGLAGIELSLDNVLTGAAGRIVRAKNAYGTDMLYTKYEDYYDAENGCNVTLTIDAGIQAYVEKHLAQAVADYGARGGAAAIAMDPNTGEILALASLQNFDLNNYQAVSEEALAEIDAITDEDERAEKLAEARQLQWHNKAVEDMYEPGSTFKPITMAMALEEGVVSKSSTFYCGGSFAVPGDSGVGRHCWRRQGHGMQTLTECLQHSCNVALIQIAQRVGAEKFYEYVDAFGFRDPTGIGLSGEAGSLWWDSALFCDPYNQTQLAAASFGQTFNISPLQLVRAMSAVVNGGYLMQPYLVREVTDTAGNVVSRTEPEVIRQVVSAETSAAMREMLEAVVGDMKEGTGKNAYVAGYRIGGKTGTSTDTVHEAATGEKEYIVSFIGVAPADDPQIVLLVLIDDPDPNCGTAVSGGAMGAPTVGAMLADILPYMGIAPEYSEAERENMDRSVPGLIGLTAEAAKETLAKQNLSCRVIGEGETVTMVLPVSGTVVAAKSEVLLFLGSEPSRDLEAVPDLTDLPYETARQRLGYLALYLSAENYISDSGALITRQSIPPGTMVEHGTVVRVSIYSDDEDTNAQF